MSRNKAVVTKLFCLLLEYVVGARCTSFQMQSQECDSVLTKCNHFHEKECFICTDSLTSSSDLRSHCSNCQVLMDVMDFSTSKSDGYVHPQLNSYLLIVMTLPPLIQAFFIWRKKKKNKKHYPAFSRKCMCMCCQST